MSRSLAKIDTSRPSANLTYRSSWLQLSRPMTWTGTIAPVLVGSSLAAGRGPVYPAPFLAMLLAALLVQGATNMLNDYFDVLHGQDLEKWAAPGDPGHGRGPAHRTIPTVAGAMFGLAVLLGAWLAVQTGWWVALAGTLGIVVGYFYSAGPRPLSSLGLGEPAAAVFMGPVTTALAFAVQGHRPDGAILAISLPSALLIASMILSNNIRDIAKDQGFRRTMAIALGRPRAVRLLTVLLTGSYLWLGVMVARGLIPWTASWAFLALPLAVRLRHSLRAGAPRSEEMAGMKWAAFHYWAFGLLFAAGLWLGR
ncbi:prenyltransferase [Kyrpidia spormannii]|uniref:UbiA prenyltransferase n=1 Tax=Kyrpidia spormannii TaxID=2055160 RepID=A0ACA8Z7W3_9BACL|nr:prenyltransferase [Kyrpidia spormannii]CAB3391404.1 UbiA prenyltransferase [Kyrpidia spormannii]